MFTNLCAYMYKMGILTTVSTSIKIQGSVLTIALFSQLYLEDSCTWHPQCSLLWLFLWLVPELVVELVLALGPELVLEFAPVELGLSHLDLQSTPLGLQLVSAQVHVEFVVVQLESALVHLAIQTI
ncbi:hypothetical protein Tco_1023170 [Tanacetum coccineum]